MSSSKENSTEPSADGPAVDELLLYRTMLERLVAPALSPRKKAELEQRWAERKARWARKHAEKRGGGRVQQGAYDSSEPRNRTAEHVLASTNAAAAIDACSVFSANADQAGTEEDPVHFLEQHQIIVSNTMGFQ